MNIETSNIYESILRRTTMSECRCECIEYVIWMCSCVRVCYYRIVSLRSTSYRCYIHQFHIEHFAFIVLWCVSSPYRIHKTGIFSPILSQFSSTWYIHWRIYRKQYRELEQWPKQCVFVYLTSVKRKER